MTITEPAPTPVLFLDIDGTVREGKSDPLGKFVNGPEDVRVFPAAVERFGNAVMIGLRADESAKRSSILNRTTKIITSEGVNGYSPIARWTATDSYAAHTWGSIGVNPVYAKLEALGVDAKQRRVGLVAGSAAAHMGRLVWLRHGWPDLWDELCEKLPRLREKAG